MASALQQRNRRHGSDQRGSDPRIKSRDSDRAGSARPQFGNLREPAGAQERIEWMDILSDVKERVTYLEKTNRTLAQGLAQVNVVQQAHDSKFEVLAKDYPAYKQYVEAVLHTNPKSVENAIKFIDDRIGQIEVSGRNEDSRIFEAIDIKSAIIESRMECLERLMADMRDAMGHAYNKGILEVPINTLPDDLDTRVPGAQRQDPFQRTAGDAWKRASFVDEQ